VGHVRHCARLLDLDPDLGADLSAADFDRASDALIVPTQRVGRGPWTPGDELASSAVLGLLVAEGLVSRRLSVAGRASMELLGPGDILHALALEVLPGAVDADVRYTVLSDTTVGVLDQRTSRALAEWPPILREVVGRMERRARNQGIVFAISQARRLETRVVLLLCHLADRWGRVETGGVFVPARLSQESIGELLHAQRPSVNRAMRRLEVSGAIARRRNGWLLDPTLTSRAGAWATAEHEPELLLNVT
jgi:CRP-like cAMP-binding protein